MMVTQILRLKIKNIFRQAGNENQNGLDIALCMIDKKTNILEYAGAFNSLIIIRNKNLTEYKAIRNPIGFYPIEEKFKTTSIQLENNDIIYLYSDGFPDQNGGKDNKKFSRLRFNNLISEVSNYPIWEQKEIFEKIFSDWQGTHTQRDDLTLMGIKWKI